MHFTGIMVKATHAVSFLCALCWRATLAQAQCPFSVQDFYYYSSWVPSSCATVIPNDQTTTTNNNNSNSNSNADGGSGNKMLLLQLDYLSYTFLGGVELGLQQACSPNNAASSTTTTTTTTAIPLETYYDEPTDFGGIQVTYSPSHETVFAASIVWLGGGDLLFPPAFTPSTNFAVSEQQQQQQGGGNNTNSTNSTAPAFPGADEFQIVFVKHTFDCGGSNYYYFYWCDYYRGESETLEYGLGQIWEAISALKIVSHYRNQNSGDGSIGVMLYTPSVGFGNPKEWYWVVFLLDNSGDSECPTSNETPGLGVQQRIIAVVFLATIMLSAA